MRRVVFILALFFGGPAVAESASDAAVAQQERILEIAESFAERFRQENRFDDENACRSRLAERQATFSQVGAADIKPMELILEAHRIICEQYRVLEEIEDRQAERGRLLSEAARLDATWQRDKAADPDGVVDFPGRDASQRVMRADARALGRVARSLNIVAEDLESESSRLLSLAIRDMDRFIPSEIEVMRLAADADGEKSLQEGFRDLLPKVT